MQISEFAKDEEESNYGVAFEKEVMEGYLNTIPIQISTCD